MFNLSDSSGRLFMQGTLRIVFLSNKYSKRIQMREKWSYGITNELEKTREIVWTVVTKQRMCSKHFVNGEPTYENPAPTLNIG